MQDFSAVYTMGGTISKSSLCDVGFQVIVVKNPRSRLRQGLPLDCEQRPLACHPLGPSLCSLSLKLRSQPEPHFLVVALVLVVTKDILRPTRIFGLTSSLDSGQSMGVCRKYTLKAQTAQSQRVLGPTRTQRRRPAYATDEDDRTPKRHHGASDVPQKWIHPRSIHHM